MDMAGIGGKNPRAGRPKGSPNKTTLELRALAGKHSKAAIAELVRLMNESKVDAVRVQASTALLDRAHGRPAQAITGADGGDIVITVQTGVSRGDS